MEFNGLVLKCIGNSKNEGKNYQGLYQADEPGEKACSIRYHETAVIQTEWYWHWDKQTIGEKKELRNRPKH